MKKTLILLLCLVLLTSAPACGKLQVNEERLEELLEIMDLGTFLQTVDLPDNFSIGFNAADVKSVDSAKIYKAVPLELDADEVAKKLLKREIVSTKVYAEGPQFETSDNELKEYLTVFDGGKSAGVDSGVVGGLNYSVIINGEWLDSKQGMVIAGDPGPPDSIAQKWGYNLKSDYASFADLSFMSYKDALAAVEELLYDTLGFPELEVAEAYSMDLETMLKHYELYKAAGGKKEITFSKDDECYVFFFRQVIDGIPLANVRWQKITISRKIAPVPTVKVYYTRDGVRRISAGGLYDIIEDGEDKPLISAAAALKKVIDDYSEVFLENQTRVIAMELCYVGVMAQDGYELIPAWIFCIAEAIKVKDPVDGTENSYDLYTYYVVNAITGDRIE